MAETRQQVQRLEQIFHTRGIKPERTSCQAKKGLIAEALSSGVIHLVAANGDVINGVSVGRGEPTDTPNLTHVIQLVTITGGTERFQGATGSFTSDALHVNDTKTGIGLSSGSLKGTISTPGSTN